MSRKRTIESILDSVSITHKFDRDKLIFLNTSDVLEGKILIDSYMKVDSLKGQAKKTIKNDDILYSEIRPKNKRYAYVNVSNPEEYVVSTKLMVLRNKTKDVLTRYVYYFLTSEGTLDYLQMRAENRIGSFPQITFDVVKVLQLNVPEPKIQKKIIDVISAIDSKMEINNHINLELEAMAKTIYDYWFVQFDFPNEKGKPYKKSGGKMVWNALLKKEIPEKWIVTKIGKILHTSLGGTPSTKVKEYWENGTFSWLNSGEIANFPIIDSELKITQDAIKNSATDLLPRGSVMLSITRHLRPSILGIDACANQSVVGIKESGDIRCYFLYPYLQNEIPRLMSLRSGAQQPHINKETVDDSNILVPNEDSNILKTYNLQVGGLYELIINNAFQNQKLKELRDWLLPMLMSGQVKVN